PWSPLAGGLLTGKYQRNTTPPEDSRFANVANNPHLQRRMVDAIFDVVEGLQPLADAKGITLAQFALAWTMHQPGITSPIIGPRTMEQLQGNLHALNIKLSAEDLARLDEIWPGPGGPAPEAYAW
ncbi:MAG: aldo/keto reductase, partial [Anaerolineales bacterium]|nr:aldo/keto reductase [Anaerolineales bacterium]